MKRDFNRISVLDYLLDSLERFPRKPAILDGKTKRNFSQFSENAHQIAMALESRTKSINCPIAVFLPKSYECLASFIGVLLSGNLYVPLDTSSPSTRLLLVFQNLVPELIITSSEYVALLSELGVEKNRMVLIDEIDLLAFSGISARELRNHRFSGVISTDPAYIIYTSGSTGTPKGVVVSHRSIINYIEWARETFLFKPGMVIGSQAPFYFDNSTLDIYLCLSEAAKLVIVPEKYYAFPARLLEYVNQVEISFVFWVPSVLIAIANLDMLSSITLPRLRYILFAGEVMPTRQLNYWVSNHSSALYANLYGPTEITVDCTYFIVPGILDENQSVPIGLPCRNTDILVLNDSDKLCIDNEVGELCVRGTSLALGYWKDFEKTRRAFSQNPLNENHPERIYRTGDLVSRGSTGLISYIGRKDHQIKHQGYRIELGEIETAALKLPEIDNVCVLYNQERKRITMIYEADADLTPPELRKNLAKHLMKYMLPVDFHRIDALPRTPNGKIDRHKLTEIYLKKLT